MQQLDLTLPTLAANLALDEVLLRAADAGPGAEVLRFWEWPTPAVVLGAGGVIADDVNVAACQADGVPLARRSSGGGTVLLGPGCLLFSLVLRYDRAPELAELGPSYRFILERVARGLGLPGVERAGVCDLALGGRKFSGNAQQRKRHALLHHGTLLLDADLGGIGQYLKLPPRRPAYRADRDHAAFVLNLGISTADVRAGLCRVWGADEVQRDWPADDVAALVAEKFGRYDWTWRR